MLTNQMSVKRVYAKRKKKTTTLISWLWRHRARIPNTSWLEPEIHVERRVRESTRCLSPNRCLT